MLLHLLVNSPAQQVCLCQRAAISSIFQFSAPLRIPPCWYEAEIKDSWCSPCCLQQCSVLLHLSSVWTSGLGMWSSVAVTFLRLRRATKFFFFIRYLLWLFPALPSSFWEDPLTIFLYLFIFLFVHLYGCRLEERIQERRSVWASGMCWFPASLSESCPNSEQMKSRALYGSCLTA